MTQEQPERCFWEILATNEHVREDGTIKAFDVHRDPCKFWKEVHGKGYADGLTPARIAEFVAPLWLHGMNHHFGSPAQTLRRQLC